jgi:ADP-heptose:LPS heptosyltransferase
MANSWRKFLVIRFSSIGDIIQTTSVLNTIKKYYPDCRIDFLTLKKYKPLLVNHSSIDHIHSIDAAASIKSIIDLIKKKEYQIIVDLHNSLRSKLIRKNMRKIESYCVSKPRKNRFSLFLNHQNYFDKDFNQKNWLHEPLTKILPGHYESSQISLNVIEKEKKDAITLLNKNGLKNNKYFTLIPGAAWKQKQWPVEKYIELIKLCVKKYDLTPVLLGAQEDEVCKEILLDSPSITIDLSGKTNLRQAIAVLSGSILSIGSDTGFTYASEALGIPTVAILGPTSFETGAGVLSKKSINVQKNDIWCRPCSQNGSFPCYRKTQYCMEKINTKDVLLNVEKLLA